ncbi:hypothetical protein M430DRAFT_19470 [Amorphotheca resinae ATCC 22711]|uniref:Uncharacterized protein n=1 Tax=Amorphotheca resinae ATCC 22711 TaxID=857342 RepID=A0A2T3AZF3_AMORE|nr:hypothetical protein M430DRAFT_19470 [Amorphotheca resinae ATCC 22711]PSS16483.1 hypothetical protein M430DRAFT_19470 [Amorphotheca resinae ATCC 22711]
MIFADLPLLRVLDYQGFREGVFIFSLLLTAGAGTFKPDGKLNFPYASHDKDLEVAEEYILNTAVTSYHTAYMFGFGFTESEPYPNHASSCLIDARGSRSPRRNPTVLPLPPPPPSTVQSTRRLVVSRTHIHLP